MCTPVLSSVLDYLYPIVSLPTHGVYLCVTDPSFLFLSIPVFWLLPVSALNYEFPSFDVAFLFFDLHYGRWWCFSYCPWIWHLELHFTITFSRKRYLTKKLHASLHAYCINNYSVVYLTSSGQSICKKKKKKALFFLWHSKHPLSAGNSTLIHYRTDLLLLDMQFFVFIMPLRHSNKTVITE